MQNSFYPATYQPIVPNYQPTINQQSTNGQPTQQTNNGIIWVQGIEAAKAYPVGAGNNVLLMDSEANVFYIKSTDQSGMPMPLRVFDYTERTAQSAPAADYVTREEFDQKIAELTKKKVKKDE